METTIYADVLITINFIIDLLILRLCVLLTGIRQRTGRRYLAALLGAVSSLLIFVPVNSFWFDLLSRGIVSAAVVAAAYGRQPPRIFGRLMLIFYGVSFLVAGFVIGLWMVLPPGLVAFGNGVVYLGVKPMLLVGSVIAAYGFVELFNRIFYWRRNAAEIYSITVWRGGRPVSFPALADTGNRLVEPFSGQPVVVTWLGAAAPLLSAEEERYIREDRLDGDMPETLRVAAYTTVDGAGMLKAFRPDRMTVKTEDGEKEIIGYVAVSGHRIGDGTYSAVFNPKVIQILT